MTCCLPELPPEILIDIFALLPVSDVKMCRCTCSNWCRSASAVMGKRTKLVLDGNDEASRLDRPPPFSHAASAAFRSLEFKHLSIGFSSDDAASRWAWGSLVSRATSLTLSSCPIENQDLIRILSHCGDGRLQRLTLANSRDFFADGVLLMKPVDFEVAGTAMRNVMALDLSRNRYLSDGLFSRLTACCPKVRELTLDHNHIQHHLGIYKKFYPPDGNNGAVYDSNDVFTFRSVLSYVRKQAPLLQRLSLQDTTAPGSVVEEIATIKDLNLHSLDIGRNPAVKQDKILTLVRHQRQLTELRLDRCRRVLLDYDDQMKEMFRLMKGLKKLSLRYLSCPTGFKECVSQLGCLEFLDASFLDAPTKHLADGIVGNQQLFLSLTHLILTNCSGSQVHLCRMLDVTVNLQVLNLEQGGAGVNDEVMRTICNRLYKLTSLNVNWCDDISSLGFANVHNLKRLSSLSMASLLIDDETLDLFAFEDLRFIEVSHCQLITSHGFDVLTRQNPNIEQFVAAHCGQLDDDGLLIMVKNLRRLKQLDISQDRSITDESVGQIRKLCSHLTSLNVRGCDGLTPEALALLGKDVKVYSTHLI